MIWVDYILLAIIAISALLSLWRGFVKEAISLASWIAALWIAMLFFYDLADFMQSWIESPTVREWVAFGTLFFTTVLVGGLVNYLAGQLVAKTGLTATDRTLGMVFGITRGIVIVAVLVLLAGWLTGLPQESWWQEALLLGHFQDMAVWLRSFLPADVAEHIQF